MVTLPLDANIIKLGAKNAPRTCKECGDPAEFYIIVTDEMAAENADADADLSTGEWPVNAFLCRPCFADADRVENTATLLA